MLVMITDASMKQWFFFDVVLDLICVGYCVLFLSLSLSPSLWICIYFHYTLCSFDILAKLMDIKASHLDWIGRIVHNYML